MLPNISENIFIPTQPMAYTNPGGDSISERPLLIEELTVSSYYTDSRVCSVFGSGVLWVTHAWPSTQRRAISSPVAVPGQGTLVVLFSHFSFFIDLMSQVMTGLHNSSSCSSFVKPMGGTNIVSHLEYYRERFPQSIETKPQWQEKWECPLIFFQLTA